MKMNRKLRWGWFGLGMICAIIAGATFAAGPARAWEKEPVQAYHERRARLVAETGDGLIVLFGYREEDIAASTTPFRQNENFYYLTGWDDPGAMMLLVPQVPEKGEGGKAQLAREILFIPPRDYRMERWTGPVLGPEDPDAPSRTGFATVESTAMFQTELLEALKKFPRISTELTPQPESGEDCFQKDMVSKLKKMAPLASLRDLRPLVTRMRMVKSPTEMVLMRKAVDRSVGAQQAAMEAVHPGVWEYQIAARMKYEFERRGCEWPSYPPIVGSGFYSTVLHYDQDSREMQDGDVVVLDVAGSYSGYASDITRTLPVNGHFTPRQREIYEIVLGAQEAALAHVEPGVLIGRGRKSLQRIAYDYINSHGKDLHGKPLGQYFIHGLGHSVGLNVHDPADYNEPLQPGMVITIEPGIYIPEEKIGVRIEDMVLVTPNGHELLTARLTRDPEAIEKIMRGK